MKNKTRQTILCVDDEKIVLDSLKLQLKNSFGWEYEIEIAESGLEALEIIDEICNEYGAPPSVLICDQIMPHMKGDQLLTAVKAKFPKILCILLTGQADLNDVVRVINNAGLYRYIAKPWDKEDLNLTVKQALIAYQQDEELEVRNEQLLTLNKNLEAIVEDRTKELSVKNRELQKKDHEISESLAYSKRLQDAMLPPASQIKSLFPEHFMIYKPKNIVSGDFYCVTKSGNMLIVAVIDCTGHGVPGALMSMIGNQLLYNIIITNQILEPKDILTKMHELMVVALNQKDSGLQDGMDMAICIIDTDRKKLKFAGAKNPLTYTKDGVLHYIKGDLLPIGGMIENTRSYIQHELDYDATMNFYLMSDGYVDQFGGIKNKKFNRKSLMHLIQEHHAKPMREQGELFEKVLLEWQESEEQNDDITLFGFNITL